jgi:hypothetical protein
MSREHLCSNDKAYLADFMSHPKLFVTTPTQFLPDLRELAAKKTAIFPLPIHSNQVKKNFS